MSISTPTVTYCNLTSDLLRAYARIFDLIQQRQVTGWTLTSGQAATYEARGVGYVSAVFQDGVKLTSTTSIALVEATASRYYYDSSADILYVHTSTGADPDGAFTIEVGVDKETFLGECRAIAQGQFEAMLDTRFPRPIPEARSGGSYLARKYDDGIVQAVAKLTCAVALSSYNPATTLQDDMPKRLEAEALAIITDYNEGRRRFSWEVTTPEAGKAVIYPLSVSGDGMLEVYGDYVGEDDAIYRIKIITGGAVGTATYQYSTDNGATYNGTDLTTNVKWISISTGEEVADTPNYFQIKAGGLWVRFDSRGGTFTANDTWQLFVTAKSRTVNSARIGSISLRA